MCNGTGTVIERRRGHTMCIWFRDSDRKKRPYVCKWYRDSDRKRREGREKERPLMCVNGTGTVIERGEKGDRRRDH